MSDKKTVWVIDKDRDYQDTLRLQLENFSHAFQLVSLYDAEEALLQLQNQELHQEGLFPDFILLDLNMPVMDGWDFLNEYLHIKHQLPQPVEIYIVTSSIREKDKQEATRYEEVSGYQTKPLDMRFFESLL